MNQQFTLKDGLKNGSETHKDVEIRALTAGDIIIANEKSREVFLTPQGPILMCPSDKVMIEVLCRVITKFGDLKMPLSKEEFYKLSLTDFDILTEKYLEMREKSDLDALGRDSQPL
ncbi:MAG: phage tail assembly protein [Proteobacteria bacterium]|nr:phage tail assembly protein [Pseudomonadota bacterium]